MSQLGRTVGHFPPLGTCVEASDTWFDGAMKAGPLEGPMRSVQLSSLWGDVFSNRDLALTSGGAGNQGQRESTAYDVLGVS